MVLNGESGFFLYVCLFERHTKPNKMKDERRDQKCSHTGNVGIQCSHSANTWKGEGLLMFRDDAGIKTHQSR